jgi:hypothetical protein
MVKMMLQNAWVGSSGEDKTSEGIVLEAGGIAGMICISQGNPLDSDLRCSTA